MHALMHMVFAFQAIFFRKKNFFLFICGFIGFKTERINEFKFNDGICFDAAYESDLGLKFVAKQIECSIFHFFCCWLLHIFGAIYSHWLNFSFSFNLNWLFVVSVWSLSRGLFYNFFNFPNFAFSQFIFQLSLAIPSLSFSVFVSIWFLVYFLRIHPFFNNFAIYQFVPNFLHSFLLSLSTQNTTKPILIFFHSMEYMDTLKRDELIFCSEFHRKLVK